MGYFGIPFRNGVPIGLGSVVSFGAQQFDPSELFVGGTAGAWYDPSDLTTMFTTSAGMTPVAMPGQGSAVSVGLMLDKSQNGVGTNGSFRYNRATYTQTFGTSWTNNNTTITSTNNLAPDGTLTASLLTASGTTPYFYNSFSTNPSTTNVCSLHVKAGTASVFWLYFNSGAIDGTAFFDLSDLTTQAVAGSSQTPANLTISNLGNGWYRISASWNNSQPTFNWGFGFCDAKGSLNCTVGRTAQVWGFQVQSGTAPTAYQRIDANWYSTMAGNHAIAFNDTTARPELRARVNLLRWSEVFDATASGSAWINSGVTVTDGVLAPNGTNTADTITGTTGTYPNVRQAITLPAAGTYKASCYFQKTSGATRFPSIELNFSPGNALVVLNTDTGVAANAQGTPTNISVSDAGGYWLVSFDVAINITSATFYIYPASSSNGTSTAPNLTGSCVAWGADLRPANIGANVPAYQRIADANTYDTSGFPLYLRFDGVDDSMYTPANLNLSGTDKATVFAGVRKLSDAATGFIAELSQDFNSNNGSFLALPNGNAAAPANTFASASRGAAGAATNQYAVSAATPAPVTNVFTVTHDIPGDLSAIRLNGAASGTNATGDKGSGNFGTYPLFIGSRNNASFFLNGHLHSLIIAGSAVSAGNISATEQWVADRTGISIP